MGTTKRALLRINAHPDRSPTAQYRVEHHDGDTVRCLGLLSDVSPHVSTLDPFISTLLRNGVGGELRLINETTGAIVARREIRSFESKALEHFRRVRG